MSRNLCSDCCVECGEGPVKIADLSGSPIEFRGYGKYVPVIGARWDCPNCKAVYFAAWRTRGQCIGCSIAGVYPPDYAGLWEIDLSYYATYNDECWGDDIRNPQMPPMHLVTEGREDQRFSLGSRFAEDES